MNEFGISEKSFSLICTTFQDFPDIERVLIFGSRAKGNWKKGSDIDLAIYGNKLNANTVLDLAGKLNEGLPIPYHIDIVAPQLTMHKGLKEHIQRVGELFWEAKPS